MRKRLSYVLYRVIRFFAWLFSPKFQIHGLENLPDGPAVVAGNHAQIYGPVFCEIFFPGPHKTWTIGELMHFKEVPDYAFHDFWAKKPVYSRWFFRIVSYIFAPFSVCLFNNADCIGVYHDSRIMKTLRQSITALHDGNRILIMPECDQAYNNIVCEFQQGFVDVASLYYRKYKEELSFVPMYIAPALKAVYLGKPVRFDASVPLTQERVRICDELKTAITRIARELPEHTVVPYPNLSKKQYITNRQTDLAFAKNGLSMPAETPPET